MVDMEKISEVVVRLGQLALQFGRVNRLPLHEDGVTPESDTDHTVMLGLVACAYAKEAAPHLDLGLVAQFALVHDLVEAYAGDTSTLGLDEIGMQDKKAREHKALERIEREFGTVLPWVPDTIRAYESLETPEARFVKTIDKGLPSITHSLNGGVALRKKGYTRATLQVVREKERDMSIHTYAVDQPEATNLRDALMDRVYATYR